MLPLSCHKTTNLSQHFLLKLPPSLTNNTTDLSRHPLPKQPQPLSLTTTSLYTQAFTPASLFPHDHLVPMLHGLHLTALPTSDSATVVSPPDPFYHPGTATSTVGVGSAPRTVRPSPGSASFQPRSELATYNIHPRAQASDVQAATHTRNMPHYDQSPTRTHKAQNEQNALNIKNLESNLNKDLQIVNSQLRASKKHYEDLNARFVASDGERTRISNLMSAKLQDDNKMSSLMAADLMAKADSQEFYARRLRESINLINQQQSLNGGPQRLRLTASRDPTQHESDGAFELDAGHATPQMFNGSETSEDTAYEDREVSNPATKEHQSPNTRVSQVVDDEQVHQTSSVEEAQWQPYTIAQLTPLTITSSNDETFSWEELVTHLGGNQYSPGLYFSCNESPSRILQGRTYWLLEGNYEPFAPTSPGQHGAKLTAFFNDTLTAQGDAPELKDYNNVPVFICLKPGEGYTYVGQYSQPRFSDKLSYSELLQHVPSRVLEYWAKQLADPHRPSWITDQLMAHFWPIPSYTGPFPTDSAIASPATGVTEPNNPERVLEKRVALATERYALELKAWKKDAKLKVTLLTEEALMGSWHNSDTDEEKGLRLWWEYLQCVGFDDDFYQKLVDLKKANTQSARKTAAVVPLADISTISGDVVGMQSNKASKHRHDSFASPTSTGASTVKAKQPSMARSNRPANIAVPGPYPQADLQAAREMHDKATKASEHKRGRSDKRQTRPPYADKFKW
jgi:hypothetical protein